VPKRATGGPAALGSGSELGFGPEPDANDDRWWLWDIWVNESDRGRGVGREVLALVEAEVRRLHGMSVGLSVFGSNDQARRLYERSGYEVVSVRMRKLV
jgi:ribosomal protein S18 acetylase RimI-like enzyme